MSIQDEIKKRRTFAIISHPDAGKTTITEQLLYFGGEIREAGTVKGKKTGNFAKSDWMDIEKQRGISVTSSVMQFDYAGKRVNILDTPGHEDFSEDTYRTLMAVDAAVMVVDSAKGIEAQTKKLFEVVKHRGIPVFTFMNKLDRDGREPLDLLEELEEVLSLDMEWKGKVKEYLSGKNMVASSTDMATLLAQFFRYLHASGVNRKTEEDTKRHFVNWVCKQGNCKPSMSLRKNTSQQGLILADDSLDKYKPIEQWQ